MHRYQFEAADWDLDLTRRDWRIEAAIGVKRGAPFAGVRLARYEVYGPTMTRRMQLWEESLLVVPSTPRTGIIAIGNVLSGAINRMYEDSARKNAEEAARKYAVRHRSM